MFQGQQDGQRDQERSKEGRAERGDIREEDEASLFWASQAMLRI